MSMNRRQAIFAAAGIPAVMAAQISEPAPGCADAYIVTEFYDPELRNFYRVNVDAVEHPNPLENSRVVGLRDEGWEFLGVVDCPESITRLIFRKRYPSFDVAYADRQRFLRGDGPSGVVTFGLAIVTA